MPLQVAVESSATVTSIVALVTFLLATVLAVLVTYRFLQGYLRSRSRPILLLAIGMFLLAPAPMLLRLVVGNVLTVASPVRVLSTTAVEAMGLLVILAVIYRGDA
jgi:multisubunit Na+/H+ antiporter MnhF subunit